MTAGARDSDDRASDDSDARDGEIRLAAIATELADAVEAALPGWVERSVLRLVEAHRLALEAAGAAAGGATNDASARDAAADAGRVAAAEVGAELRALLGTDVDEQRANPLALLRGAVRYPAGVLRGLGVPPVVRGEFEERTLPDDHYGLAPATWSDVDPALHELGLTWGAAKANVVLARRRAQSER